MPATNLADATRLGVVVIGRNEGMRRIAAVAPGLEFIQFIDGDCELMPGWLDTAARVLDQHLTAAAVCGRRRERHPEHSVYNLLCDMEWDTPIGQTLACGGDVLVRTEALRQVVGFRDDLIAGEEPELCVRLRAKGWSIWRLDAEMTLHDAASVFRSARFTTCCATSNGTRRSVKPRPAAVTC